MNLFLHGIEDFHIVNDDTLKNPAFIENGQLQQFDLVLANILARPLTEMAADIVRVCRPGGCLVLSGLLEIQADGVTAAYKAQGLPEPRRIIDGEWAALVWDSVK